MDSQVSIRAATPSDIPEIFSFVVVPEVNASDATRFCEVDELREWVRDTANNILLVAETKGKIVGFLNARIMSHLWCYLDNIVVAPAHRNQGIGTKLLERLYGELQERNINYVSGLAGQDHRKTRKYWEKQGFKEGKTFVWIEKEL